MGNDKQTTGNNNKQTTGNNNKNRMNTEQQEEKLRRAEQFLRIIERTRLLYNTSAELSEVVGFSIESGNGLARKGGRSAFMKDAILRELFYMAEERTSLNLERVLESYVEVDSIMQVHKRELRGKDVCRQLIRHFYASDEVEAKLSALAEKLQRHHIPLLVLMLTDALPPLSAKGGDVEGIAGDYRRVISLLKDIVCEDIHFSTLPAMTEMESWSNKNPEKLCRIDLLDCVNITLEAYGSISTPEQLSRVNVEQLSRQFIPDLDGIWTEDEASTVFWKFEELENGHNLYRYVLDNERRELTFTEYYVRCFREEDYTWALVMHPHLIQCIVPKKRIPTDYFANMELTMDEEGTLTFSPMTTDSRWFQLKHLKRSGREDYFLQLLEDENYQRVNRFPEDEYTFFRGLAALTEDAVYVSYDDGFLRVPKSLNPQLPDVCFGENIGLIHLRRGHGKQKDAGSTYLAFDDRSLYYEVTTARQRKALGIEVVERIE